MPGTLLRLLRGWPFLDDRWEPTDLVIPALEDTEGGTLLLLGISLVRLAVDPVDFASPAGAVVLTAAVEGSGVEGVEGSDVIILCLSGVVMQRDSLQSKATW